jgi:hypothetical protein
MAMTYPDDNLAEVPLEVVLGLYFGDVFKQCEESGMVVPFVGCAISPNGSVIALRMDGKSDAQVLAEHTEGAGFRFDDCGGGSEKRGSQDHDRHHGQDYSPLNRNGSTRTL